MPSRQKSQNDGGIVSGPPLSHPAYKMGSPSKKLNRMGPEAAPADPKTRRTSTDHSANKPFEPPNASDLDVLPSELKHP